MLAPEPVAVLSLAPLAAALLLGVVHGVAPYLHVLRGTPRSVWLSLAGGVSVAYVFVHLLPELAAGQAAVSRAVGDGQADGALRYAERHVYLIALAGLAAFYGLDKLAYRARGQRAEGEEPARDDDRVGEADADATAGAGVFWVHMGAFGLYNLLVGYLLVRGERRAGVGLSLFAIAMALHFVVTDFGLAEHHKRRYAHLGWWLLCLALALGVGAGYAVALPEAAVAMLVAFLAGGVILNVLKEEVPGERRSRFWAFALGMAGYSALLLVAE